MCSCYMLKFKIRRFPILLRLGFLCFVITHSMPCRLSAQTSNAARAEASNAHTVSDTELLTLGGSGWHTPYVVNPPSRLALKFNFLYAATLTPNLGFEVGLGRKTSFELTGGYNFYSPRSKRHWKHWLVQPELRYWFCERFNGSFVGVHALGGEYNFARISNLPFTVFDDLENYRYEGHYYGGGITYGYQWILGKRLNLEMSVGAGYARVHYQKYNCPTCGNVIEEGTKDYLGPTKAVVSLLLFL